MKCRICRIYRRNIYTSSFIFHIISDKNTIFLDTRHRIILTEFNALSHGMILQAGIKTH